MTDRHGGGVIGADCEARDVGGVMENSKDNPTVVKITGPSAAISALTYEAPGPQWVQFEFEQTDLSDDMREVERHGAECRTIKSAKETLALAREIRREALREAAEIAIRVRRREPVRPSNGGRDET